DARAQVGDGLPRGAEVCDEGHARAIRRRASQGQDLSRRVERRARERLVAAPERGKLRAQREPARVVLAQLAVTWRAGERVIETRAQERGGRARIGELPLPGELRELRGAALAHG